MCQHTATLLLPVHERLAPFCLELYALSTNLCLRSENERVQSILILSANLSFASACSSCVLVSPVQIILLSPFQYPNHAYSASPDHSLTSTHCSQSGPSLMTHTSSAWSLSRSTMLST